MRTALLAPASQDLRSPLASAKAAVSCLRSSGIQPAAGDTDELLAAVEESLGRLACLAVSLPDIRRPRTGALMPAIDGSYWRPWTLPGESGLAGSPR